MPWGEAFFQAFNNIYAANRDMPRRLLHKAFEKAVAASHPSALLPQSRLLTRLCKSPPKGSVRIIAAGKAAAAMVEALENHWPCVEPPVGVAVAPDGYLVPTRWIEVIAAAHPHPDSRCIAAAKKLSEIAKTCGPDDVLVVLLSGGGSSLLSWPVEGVSLEAYVSALRDLMAAGADIEALNTVRRHLSRLAGGGLAALAGGARIEALLLSDVVGDSESLIASGPISPDMSTFADARNAFTKHGVTPSADIEAALAGPDNETPEPGDPIFEKVCTEVIPSSVWMAPVAELLRAEGYETRIIGEQLAGDAADLARLHARAAIEAASEAHPVALLSGGEATTHLKGDGEGGPNAEFCLELARALEGRPGIWALACDSDGVDGASNAAGGVIGPDTLVRAAALGCSVDYALVHSNSTGLLKRLGDAVVVGPTMTNVNDVRVVLANPPA